MTTMIKLPGLLPANSIRIQVFGFNARSNFALEWSLANIDRWPNRGEIKQVGQDRRLYLYNGDHLLLDNYDNAQGLLPDVFGLKFKRVVDSHVDFKSKTQNITAIFTAYDILNSIEDMHTIGGYDE